VVAFSFFKRSPARVAGQSPFRGFFFWISVAGFFVMAGIGLREIVAEIQARRWPTVSCEILENRVTREMRHGEFRYVPFLRFRYIIAGRVYTSERIRVVPESTYEKFASAASRLAAYPAGRKMLCHVNPSNPAQAVLESKPDYVALCLSPFLLVIWALRERVALADWWMKRRGIKSEVLLF
jgi:hypothetical protein